MVRAVAIDAVMSSAAAPGVSMIDAIPQGVGVLPAGRARPDLAVGRALSGGSATVRVAGFAATIAGIGAVRRLGGPRHTRRARNA